MKKTFNIFVAISAIMVFFLASCSEKELTPVIKAFDSKTGEQSLVVSQPVTGGNYILTEQNAESIWETVVWEDVNEAELADVTSYLHFTDSVGTSQEQTHVMQPGFSGNMAEITEAMLNEVLVHLGYYSPESLVNLQLQVIQHVGDDTLAYLSTPIAFSVIGYGGQDPTTFPKLWAVGAGLPTAGWGWDNPIVLEDRDRTDIFTTPEKVELTSEGDANFRFFAQTGWDGTSYNYPYFADAGYMIDERLVNAEDGDSNFKFIGESGEYYIVVDHVNKEVRIQDNLIAKIPTLYVPGAHQGWNPGDTYQLYSNLNDEVYIGFVNFEADQVGFKINPAPNWNEPQYGTNSAAGMSGALELGGGDIQFAGTAGTYKLTANLNDMTWAFEASEWSAVADAWGVIGSATPGGWDVDTDMTFQQGNGLLSVTIDLTVGEIKFRANDDWGLNYGDDGADGIAEQGAANIAIEADGNYTLVLDMRNPEQITYTITKN